MQLNSLTFFKGDETVNSRFTVNDLIQQNSLCFALSPLAQAGP